MTTTLGLLLAALIGVSLGLLGGGGAILAVPIFTYVMGFGAKEAIASSLVVVGVTSLFGAAEHWRERHVRLRMALIFGVFAMVGAYLGAQLATLFSDAAQLILFAVVMLVAAFFMYRDNNKEESDEDEGNSGTDDFSVAGVSVGCAAGLTVLGIAIGVLTGLVGVGGGFLIVPALVLFGKLPVKDAVGSSVLVIVMNSASGFVGYLGKVEIQWGTIVLFTALAVAGSFVGTYLVRFVPANALQKAFAVFLVAMAIFILYENRQAIPLV